MHSDAVISQLSPTLLPMLVRTLVERTQSPIPGGSCNSLCLFACFILSLTAVAGCSSSPLSAPRGDGGATGGDVAGTPGAADAAGAAGEDTRGASTTVVNVFDQIPQFGIYAESDPQDYLPPSGVLSWRHGTEYARRLSPSEQAALGADVAVRVSYWAQCDEYDRLGAAFLLLEPKGRDPEPTDPRIELVRFITPFSDFTQGALGQHVYPDADVSAYYRAMADPARDVWIGIAGGSNPHPGDACSDSDGALRSGVTAEFARVGFRYSVDLISTQPSGDSASLALAGIDENAVKLLPIDGTILNDGNAVAGHVIVIVSGHGSSEGGSEYQSTQDTVTLNGAAIGTFGTEIDCAPYAQFSPRGNPGIFKRGPFGNPRNWCPGALVPAHSFDAELAPGDNSVSLAMVPTSVPEGSYYAVSVAFSAP